MNVYNVYYYILIGEYTVFSMFHSFPLCHVPPIIPGVPSFFHVQGVQGTGEAWIKRFHGIDGGQTWSYSWMIPQ